MSAFLPVLAYQKIGIAPKKSRLKNEWTSRHRLEKMRVWLTRHNYTFITPADLSQELPAKPVLLVFFGGYQTFYTDVFPLLQKYKAQATGLVAVETLGTYNSWQDPQHEPWQNVLTVKQLQETVKSGLVKVGTLGLDGRNLLEEEPGKARQLIEESVYRLKKYCKLDACAIGFWPWAGWNEARAQHITHGLNLSVITSQKGINSLSEKHFLRILRPGFFTQFLLQKNK